MTRKREISEDANVSVFINPFVQYCDQAPFHPDAEYLEVPHAWQSGICPANLVYGSCRQALFGLGLDQAHYGTPNWNPFGSIVKSGQTVLVQPNGVNDRNFNPTQSVYAVITHGSMIRCVVDYVFKALEGKGRIIVASAPLMHCDFEHWRKLVGIDAIAKWYHDQLRFCIEVEDLRINYSPWDARLGYASAVGRSRLKGDPLGYVDVDLGTASEFSGWSKEACLRMYGSDYDRITTVKNHTDSHHCYRVSRTMLSADAIIAVPKLKVHSKVGVTVTLKGMVGTQGDKNFIPHFRIGPPSRGGDEYPETGRLQEWVNRYRMWVSDRCLSRKNAKHEGLYRTLVRVGHTLQSGVDRIAHCRYPGYEGRIGGGNWHGNDTAWRMALDLTRIALFADRDGELKQTPQRKFLSVVDGIVAGEGEGPLSPQARPCGTIVVGGNPLAVDTVCARLMGFNSDRITLLRTGLSRAWLASWEGGADEIYVSSNFGISGRLNDVIKGRMLSFMPPKGWKDFVEDRLNAEAMGDKVIGSKANIRE